MAWRDGGRTGAWLAAAGAVLAALAVGLSAYAAHGVADAHARGNLQLASLYAFGHGIALAGRLAPGPDYKLYLSPEFVETEADFMRLKATMVRVGDVRTFDNFFVPLPTTIEPANYRAVIVWCESFSQFITAANYR